MRSFSTLSFETKPFNNFTKVIKPYIFWIVLGYCLNDLSRLIIRTCPALNPVYKTSLSFKSSILECAF